MAPITVQVALETDVGLIRQRNEDLLLVEDLGTGELHNDGAHHFELGERGLALAVLDGMGGTRAGDRASQLAGEVLAGDILRWGAATRDSLADALVHSMLRANRAVCRESRRKPECRGMGTTLTAAALIDSTLLLVHVGDSRAYILRGGERLVQVTEDQSLDTALGLGGKAGEEQELAPRHSNVILQALGISDYLDPFVAAVPLRRDDILLLCSDGISAQIPGEEMRRVLAGAGPDLAGAAAELTRLAREGGGQDNASALVARFSGVELREPQKCEAGDPPVEAAPLAPPSLVEHLRRRRVRQLLNTAGVMLALLVILAGMVFLLIGQDS